MAAKPGTSRRGLARRVTVQALYRWLVNEAPAEQLIQEFREEGLGRADVDYFQDLLNGTVREVVQLTQTFAAFLDRPVEQIDPVERAILMLGTYELMFAPQVPYKVVVDESVNLAKTFGADTSFKYINGVLDQIAKKHRAAEVAAG